MSWGWIGAHNVTIALALEVARKQGWWDAAGYHRDEVVLTRYTKPQSKGPAYIGGGPTAAALARAA